MGRKDATHGDTTPLRVLRLALQSGVPQQCSYKNNAGTKIKGTKPELLSDGNLTTGIAGIGNYVDCRRLGRKHRRRL